MICSAWKVNVTCLIKIQWLHLRDRCWLFIFCASSVKFTVLQLREVLVCDVCHQYFWLVYCVFSPNNIKWLLKGLNAFSYGFSTQKQMYTWSTQHTPRIMSQIVRVCICRSIVYEIVETLSIYPCAVFSLEEGQQQMFLFCFLCIVSSRQRQTLSWWKMLRKKVEWHIAGFNSQPCFSASVPACHIIPVLLYILLMNRIFHREAEFSYFVAIWAEVTVVAVLFELHRGVAGKGICLYFCKV